MLMLLTFLTVYLNLNTVFVDDEDDEICVEIYVDDALIFLGTWCNVNRTFQKLNSNQIDYY